MHFVFKIYQSSIPKALDSDRAVGIFLFFDYVWPHESLILPRLETHCKEMSALITTRWVPEMVAGLKWLLYR